MLLVGKKNLSPSNLQKTIPSSLIPKFIVISYPTVLLNNSTCIPRSYLHSSKTVGQEVCVMQVLFFFYCLLLLNPI